MRYHALPRKRILNFHTSFRSGLSGAICQRLSDVDMKRHVDLRNPSSLEEAISLATQFESFDLGEGHGPIAGRHETQTSRGRSAHVQAEAQLVNKKDKSTNEELASLRKQF